VFTALSWQATMHSRSQLCYKLDCVTNQVARSELNVTIIILYIRSLHDLIFYVKHN